MSMDAELDSIFKSTKSTTASKPTAGGHDNNQAFLERLQQAQKAATEHLEAQTLAGRELLKTKRQAERRIELAKKKTESETPRSSKAAAQSIDPEVNKRTLFVGNLPVACIQKAEYKQLKSHFGRHGEISSIRFRSIAFKKALPRKIAFISGNLHPDRHTLNAYIVYKDEASVTSALADNGTVFMEKHLRVDTCDESKNHNKKKSVFVGNLPFNAEEEDLWSLFEPCGSIVNVRIIRDKISNVGKGFAYVEFTEADAVTAALKMHGSLFHKRELRVFKYYGKAAQEKDANSAMDAKQRTANMSKVHPSHRQKQAQRKRGPFKREQSKGDPSDAASSQHHALSDSEAANQSPASDSTMSKKEGQPSTKPHHSVKRHAAHTNKPSNLKRPKTNNSQAMPSKDKTLKGKSKATAAAHDAKN